MKKVISIAVIFLMLVALPEQSAFAAKPKIGGICKVVGAKKTISGRIAVCTKRGSKKVWVAKKTAAPALGTVSNPAPLGAQVKFEGFSVSLINVSDNVDSYICATNSFNNGCTWDSNYDGIPDPTSQKRWVRLSFSVTNIGTDAAAFSPADIGLISNGVAKLQSAFQPVANDLIGDLKILPGSTATGSLYVWLEKGITFTGVVCQQSYYPATLTFFKLN